jgi:hypothetical protein
VTVAEQCKLDLQTLLYQQHTQICAIVTTQLFTNKEDAMQCHRSRTTIAQVSEPT